MATLKDIAKLANVSITTASRILNQDMNLVVSDVTRQRVLKVADDLSYKNPKQRTNNHKYTFAMIHWYTRTQELEDTYYLSIRLGVEKAAYDQGINLIKVFYDDLSNSLIPCDGAIAIGKFDEKEVTTFKSHYKNIVFVDSSPNEAQFDSVVIDFEHAYSNAINYLEQLGFTDIGYIGGREYTHTLKQPIGERRELYFRDYFKKQDKIYIGEFSINSGYTLMRQAITSGSLAQAYLIASDAMAIGALRALYEANINVPNDVSIMGFNDIPQSAYTIPPLSTIKVYKEHMGSTAVKLLLERMAGRTISQKVIIQTELVIRKSTKEVKL